jgi:hypothetical protein
MRGVTVGGEVAEDKSGLTPGDDVENLRACGCAEHLRHDVRQQLGERKALARYEADGDGGIEVASGDVADGEGHGEQGEAEGQGDTGKTDAETGVGRRPEQRHRIRRRPAMRFRRIRRGDFC